MASRLVTVWRRIRRTSRSGVVCEGEKLVSENRSSCEVDVWPWIVNMTTDVISLTSFGSSFKEGHMIFILQAELAHLYRHFPTKYNRKMKKIVREIQDILRRIISKSEKARNRRWISKVVNLESEILTFSKEKVLERQLQLFISSRKLKSMECIQVRSHVKSSMHCSSYSS